jgi:predicted DNA-binding transcriptional regulator AlpA
MLAGMQIEHTTLLPCSRLFEFIGKKRAPSTVFHTVSPFRTPRDCGADANQRLLRNGNFHEMIRNMTLLNDADDRYLPARAVWERYGVTSMSLYRWLDNEDMDFPRPFYIGKYRYFSLEDLRVWEARRPTVGKKYGAALRREVAAEASADANAA